MLIVKWPQVKLIDFTEQDTSYVVQESLKALFNYAWNSQELMNTGSILKVGSGKYVIMT
jgi:hypothetical protein